jgi:hypothetical protein
MPRRQTRPIPTSRRRYLNDMALARQSEADQSVNGGRLRPTRAERHRNRLPPDENTRESNTPGERHPYAAHGSANEQHAGPKQSGQGDR